MLETKEQNQIEQSVWTTLFTRWKSLVSAQPQVFGLILVCAVWALIGLPGLGQNGLWDPWEMDRAHVARQMTGSPSVLVVEDTENAAELGPIGQWLVLRYGDMLHVSVPEKGPGKGVTQKLEKAVKKLDNAVYQLVILDVSTVVEDPRAQAQVEQLIGWVERVESRNPGTEVLCLVPLPAEDDPNGLNAQDYRDALARTWSVARIELAARELSGRQWGRPGPFRSALIRELKSAESASPLTSLLALNNGGTSFLERGFWRAAEKRKLTDRLQRQVSADVVNALVDKDEFKFQAPVVSWPVGKDYAAVVEGFATGESVARQAAVDAVTEFETRVDQITPVPWWRAQFKKGGITYSRPPLDYWLIGLSFNAFGQSEFAARFPGFALGFLTLILLFRFTMRAFNPATATWSCLVLATSPLFFAQARSASSELSFVLALLCCLGGLSTMRELRFRSRDLFLVVIGCALAFLAQGMFGIVVVLCTMVTFAFLNNNGPRSMWAVVLAVAISTAAFSMWLSDQTQWTFWSHFGFDAPLQHWKLGATDRPFNLNFDVLIRQIGFGTAPWIGLIPFGIARLVGDGVGSKKPAAMMVLLWAIVPYFVQSLILKDNNHFVYAATPALAVAVGYLLHSVYATRSLGTLAAAAAAIAVGLIVGNITKSPEPLTSFLTVDPPLGSGKGAEVYPETLKVALALKMMLVSILVMLVLGPARFGARLRHIVSFFRRPVPFWIFATVALVALSVYVLAGLEYQLASSFATKAGRLLEPIHRVFVRSVFYWRPQSLALMFGAGAMLLLLVWYHTTLWHRVTGWIKTWVLTSMTAYAVGMALSLVALGMGISTHVSPLEAIAELPVLAIAILAATIGTSVAISNVRSGFSPMPLVVLFSASWLLYPVAGGSWLVAAGSLLVAGLGLAVGRFSKLPDYMTPVALGSVAGSLVMAVAAPESSDVLAVIQFIVCFACLTAGLLSCSGGIHRLKQATNDSVVLAPLGQPLAAMRALSTLLPLALVVLAVAFDSQFATALPMTVLAVLALFSASLPLGHHVGQFSDLTVRLIALVSIAVAVVLTLVWQTSVFLAFPMGLAIAYAAQKGAVRVGIDFVRLRLAGLRSRWFIAPVVAVLTLGLVILFSGVGPGEVFGYVAFWVGAGILLLAALVGVSRANFRHVAAVSLAAVVTIMALRWLLEAPAMLALLGYPRPLVSGFARELWIAGALCSAVVVSALVAINSARDLFTRGSTSFYVASATLALGLLALGLELSLSWGAYADGFVSWATWQSPVFYGGLPIACIWATWTYRRHQAVSFGALALAGWVIAGCIAQLLLGSDLNTARYVAAGDFTTPTGVLLRNKGIVVTASILLSVLVGLNSIRHILKRSPRIAFFSFVGTGIAMVLMLAIPLINKWLHLRTAVQAPDAPPFLEYLFLISRRAWIVYALVSVAIVLGTWPLIARLFARIGARHTMQRLRQTGPLLVAAVILLALFVIGRMSTIPSLALLLSPAIALLCARFAPGWPGGTRLVPLVVKGVAQIALGSLALVIPTLVAWLLGASEEAVSAILRTGLLAGCAFSLLWIVLSLFRLGLGIADVLEQIRFVGAVGFAFSAILSVDFYTQLVTGGGYANVTTLGRVLLGITAFGALVVIANAIAKFIHPLQVTELLERPRIYTVAIIVMACAFAVLYSNGHVKALSFHVSQKHILDTVAQAENGSLPEGRIFQHGIGGHSSSNFYTHAVPEVKDKASILRALSGEKNEVLTLTVAGKSVASHQVIQGFAAENDVDGDGQRDWPADAGLAQSADPEKGWIGDSTKSWEIDQWAGAWLIDSDDWRFRVIRNTTDRIYYDSTGAVAPPKLVAKKKGRKAPAFDARGSASNYYRLDSEKSVNKKATAMARQRIYALLPKIGDHAPAYNDRGSFSDLNSRFRRQSNGRHLTVLDDRSSRILLSTSHRLADEVDANWIRKATFKDHEFEALVSSGSIRSYNTKKPLDGVVTWDGKLKFLGYRLDKFSVSRGRKFNLHTYFRVEKPIKKSWKIFMHIDRSGHRIHSDHWPHAVSKGKDGKHCIGCFQTDHWQPGDIVVDTFGRNVPFGAPKGKTEIFMGFFDPQGDKRMKVTSWDNKVVGYKGSDDRVRIGSFVVR